MPTWGPWELRTKGAGRALRSRKLLSVFMILLKTF